MNHSHRLLRNGRCLLKEKTRMLKRSPVVLALLGSLVLSLAVVPSASAATPWWQVLTGSRPSSLWEPSDNVQEIETEAAEAFGFTGAAIGLEVRGTVVGCLGTGLFGSFLCPGNTGFPPDETAAQLEARLESAFGTAEVDVTGGPVDGDPFLVTGKGRNLPVIELTPYFGTASAKVLSPGGSGRLVLTLTNLGDVSVDGTSSAVEVTDELPEGVIATGAEAFAGAQASPVDCSVEAPREVICRFEGTLPPYEAIEIEIFVSLVGSPPASGAAGEVRVSGGNAPAARADQIVKASPAPVPFGIEQFSAEAEEEGGGPANQAGEHPFQFTTTVQLNAGAVHPPEKPGEGRKVVVDQPALPRNVRLRLPLGLIGNATVMPKCAMDTFLSDINGTVNGCPDATAIGVTSATIIERNFTGLARLAVPVFNLPPAHGEPARFGFMAIGVPVVIDTEVDQGDNYRVSGIVHNITQSATLLSSTISLWGTPGDPRHDNARGWSCTWQFGGVGPCLRPPSLGENAFLRQPVSCGEQPVFRLELEPWNIPVGGLVESSSFTGEAMHGCNRVPFEPSLEVVPNSSGAGTPSGLKVRLAMPNLGLLNPKATAAEGQAKSVEVTLPEGVTVNPSQANGLGACTPEQYAAETFADRGCPESAKIASVDITTPLLEEEAHGSIFVASPYDNPFDSLLALYLVAKIPERGILIKQAGKVELDPKTGQVVTTFDGLPQIPFSTFELHFNEGDRAPLVMPASCGSYDIMARFTPWNAADPNNPQPNEIVTRTSSFTVDHGPNGGACPSGTPPFKPGFNAGTENNAAGKYSPLDVRLTRNDGEQEITTFSLKMPKGVIGKLAGIPFCSDAAIAAARGRTGPNVAQEELGLPSCPDASQIGRTLVGAGVGPTLTYVPGKLYLAGPYKGAKLSVVAITAAKVGPFDLGNVVIRQGLKVDPDTAQVSTDGSSGDPIPHILQGIVVHARDIRIYVDRKDFVLNPTSCERMKAAASVLGSANGTANVTVPFQAADCANLGFKPKLALSLRGGTGRGANPRLKAVLTARKGDANIGAAVVKLPHSEFLEQGHIRTICTRVQFAAGDGNGSRCPQGSVYGRARAISPLLDEPLVGLVYLRSSNHALPDLVAALHSRKVDINLDGRIDSVNGGIRNSFEAVPDAPVTKFVLEMQGGKKGLLVNSTNICRGKHRAKAGFTGQNGKRHVLNPLVRARCGGKAKGHRKH